MKYLRGGKKALVGAFIFWSVFSTGVLMAEDDSQSPPLTLGDAIMTAVKLNPYMQAARHQLAATDAR